MIVERLANEPLLCVILSVSLYLIGCLMTYNLLDSLLKMHRSKTAAEKIKKKYTIAQKIWLIPYEENCIHAISFCKMQVWGQRVRFLCLIVYLVFILIAVLSFPTNKITVWITVGMLLCFDVPQWIIYMALLRPLFGRFKKFSFEKYHNTKDHTSLL